MGFLVAGVDGCRGGWLAVLVEFADGQVFGEEHHLCPAFAGILDLPRRPSVVAVDVPIGLLDERVKGGRACDRLLRRVLGKGRASSVFSPPTRSALACGSWEQARREGLSKQAWGIVPRIREVDALMTPEMQTRVYEGHPELAFFHLARLAPAARSKKTGEGREERLALLSSLFFQIEEGLARFPAAAAGADDVLDAYAMAWTARRILFREAECLPADPPLDSRGLAMAVWG